MNPIIIQRMRALLILRYYIEIYKLLLLVYQTAEKCIRPVSDIVKYSPFGQRISKSVDGDVEYYVYESSSFGADVIADYDNSLNLKTKYLMNPKEIDKPIIRKQNNENYYYQKDGLGSVSLIIDKNAAIKNTYRYYAFGNSKSKTETIGNRYQYTSREHDPENSHYYYRSRLYNPILGRFIQKDKYFYNILIYFNEINIKDDIFTLEIQTILAVYKYVNNQPIINNDPLGFKYNLLINYFYKNSKGIFVKSGGGNPCYSQKEWEALIKKNKLKECDGFDFKFYSKTCVKDDITWYYLNEGEYWKCGEDTDDGDDDGEQCTNE